MNGSKTQKRPREACSRGLGNAGTIGVYSKIVNLTTSFVKNTFPAKGDRIAGYKHSK